MRKYNVAADGCDEPGDEEAVVATTEVDGSSMNLYCGWVLYYDEGNNTSFGAPLSDDEPLDTASPPPPPPPSARSQKGSGTFEYRSFGSFRTIPHFWQYWNYLENRYLSIDPGKYFNMRIFKYVSTTPPCPSPPLSFF